MYRVFLNDLEFYAFHGVPEAERQVGHRYRATLSLEVDGRAAETDRIEDTVDYAAVGELAVRIGIDSQFKTVERLAYAMAEAILREFPRVQAIQVAVEKPLPPANLIADSVGVEVELHRQTANGDLAP